MRLIAKTSTTAAPRARRDHARGVAPWHAGPAMTVGRAHSSRTFWRRTIQMNTGAPMTAVMMPTSISSGRAMTRPTMSRRDEQGGAGDGRERQQPAVVGADEQAAQVRDDESDERDRPGDRGRGAAQHDRADRRRPSGCEHVLTEAGREIIAERERVHPARARGT